MLQAVWTFRIVDQDTGAPVPGVPVTVLDDHDAPLSYFASDSEGLVAIPRAERPRLRLRVGLRSEEPIELDTRQLGDATVPLAAARRAQPVAPPPAATLPEPSLAPPTQSLHPASATAHVLRFTRVGVFGPRTRGASGPVDVAEFYAADHPTTVRYGVVLETEMLWQSLGTESGDLLYSVSLSPGDEAKAVVMDGRWRRQQRERPLQIVAKMIGTSLIGEQHDAVPLEPCSVGDLAGAAAETVAMLAERAARVAAALRRRPLGVTEFGNEPVEPGALRTVKNTHGDAVVTYHFVEPLERYRVIVRHPHARPAILVPFRVPNLATRDIVRQFGHVLKRALLDRGLASDLDAILAADRTSGPAADRFFAHVQTNVAYYSATIIAAGDPAQRKLALAKLFDATGRVLTDVIENAVVGRVGNYVAFPLRSIDNLPPQWRSLLRDHAARLERLTEELTVVLPIPGVWIKAESTVPLDQGGRDRGESSSEGRDWRTRRVRG